MPSRLHFFIVPAVVLILCGAPAAQAQALPAILPTGSRLDLSAGYGYLRNVAAGGAQSNLNGGTSSAVVYVDRRLAFAGDAAFYRQNTIAALGYCLTAAPGTKFGTVARAAGNLGNDIAEIIFNVMQWELQIPQTAAAAGNGTVTSVTLKKENAAIKAENQAIKLPLAALEQAVKALQIHN